MLPRTIEEFGALLVRLRLSTPAQVTECRTALNGSGTVEDLAELMQRRKFLTSFQFTRIRKGDTDGLVLGDYKLLYRNASGSFARVYRAESLLTGDMVGLKLLRQRWAGDAHSVETFHREARMIKRFQHPNIVPVYDVGTERQFHYFTMEFVEGGNLRDFIKIRKKLNPEEASQCVLDICEGLAYALQQGATHRDMKMTNVLMSTQRVAKLVDFGLAADQNAQGSYDDDGAGRALEYAAIERGTGAPYGDPRTDLFFVGGIMYELLTGQPPWERTRDREERKLLSRYSQLTPVDQVEPGIPDNVVAICNRLLEVNPSHRYQTATEACEDLRKVLGKSDHAAGAQSTSGKPKGDDAQRSILCVESRKKQQDILREYFSGKNYRVLMVGDFDRALNRIRGGKNMPDCVLLMGEPVGDRVLKAYRDLRTACESAKIPTSTVLSEKQGPVCKGKITQTKQNRIFIQPISLTQVRLGLESGFKDLKARAAKKRSKGKSK